MLPIMNLDGRAVTLAGMISDASLVDILTVTNRDPAADNGVGFRAGTVVVIDALVGDNYRGFTPGDMASLAGKTCGAAVFSHYEMDQFATSSHMMNNAWRQRPCNVCTTARVWLLADTTGITPDSKVAVGVFKVDGVNDLAGVVKKASADSIPGWFFTGRTGKDANGFAVAEVHMRPQTATAAAAPPAGGE